MLRGALQATGFDFLWAFPLIVKPLVSNVVFSRSWNKLEFLVRIAEKIDLTLRFTHNLYYRKSNLACILEVFNLSWLTQGVSQRFSLCSAVGVLVRLPV